MLGLTVLARLTAPTPRALAPAPVSATLQSRRKVQEPVPLRPLASGHRYSQRAGGARLAPQPKPHHGARWLVGGAPWLGRRGAAEEVVGHARTSSLRAYVDSSHPGKNATSVSCSPPSMSAVPVPARPTNGDFSGHLFAPWRDGAHWLVPGVVMQGRYPYVEPSRCLDDAVGDAQVKAVMAAMDPSRPLTWVCLQDELPSQGPDFPNPFLRKGQVWKPYYGPATKAAAELQSVSPEFLHYRIVDMSVPTQEYLRQIVEELAARLEGGHQLYIHCWGGRGRAGTVGAALLSKLYPGLSAEEALEHVQGAYDTRGDGLFSPEKEEQKMLVDDFYNLLKVGN